MSARSDTIEPEEENALTGGQEQHAPVLFGRRDALEQAAAGAVAAPFGAWLPHGAGTALPTHTQPSTVSPHDCRPAPADDCSATRRPLGELPGRGTHSAAGGAAANKPPTGAKQTRL